MTAAPGQAVILCGGLGTRLGALTAATPKPLLPVGERPFLDVLLFELGRHGIRRILLLAAFQAGQIERYAADNPVARRFGLSLDVAREPDLAGTGGALWHARDRLDDRFFLLNGDSWFDFNLLALHAHAMAHPDAAATIALRALPDASRYGVVALDGDRVVRFAERPDAPGPGLVNAGVYLLRRQALDACAPIGSFEREVMPGLAASGAMRAIVRDGYFIDIGLPESLASAQAELNDRRRRPAVLLSPAAVFDRAGDDGRRWAEGAPQAIARMNEAGAYVFLAGEGDRPGLDADLRSELCNAGAHIDAVVDCSRAKVSAAAPCALGELAATWPIQDGAVRVLADPAALLAAAEGGSPPRSSALPAEDCRQDQACVFTRAD